VKTDSVEYLRSKGIVLVDGADPQVRGLELAVSEAERILAEANAGSIDLADPAEQFKVRSARVMIRARAEIEAAQGRWIRCLTCGHVWPVVVASNGRRSRDWWRCLNGCNRH
jgi:hypothetical protein